MITDFNLLFQSFSVVHLLILFYPPCYWFCFFSVTELYFCLWKCALHNTLKTSMHFSLEVIPISGATQEVRRNRGFAVNELMFQMQAPPLGFATYSVSLLGDGPQPSPVQQRTPMVIQNKVCCTTLSLTAMALHQKA